MNLDETFLPLSARAPEAEPDHLRLGAFEPRSLVAGPGARAVLWVAGCLRRCPGCMKPDLFAFDAGARVAVRRIADAILRTPGLAGVTYSGGEPFEQSLPLARLARLLKAAGLTVLAYTGYRIERLRENPERFQCLLDELDLLVDGEYRQELPGPFTWRGSSNQRVHLLSPMAEGPPLHEQPRREIQASITDEFVRLTGFPSGAVERQLRSRLESRGIRMLPAAPREPLP